MTICIYKDLFVNPKRIFFCELSYCLFINYDILYVYCSVVRKTVSCTFVKKILTSIKKVKVHFGLNTKIEKYTNGNYLSFPLFVSSFGCSRCLKFARTPASSPLFLTLIHHRRSHLKTANTHRKVRLELRHNRA